MDQMDQAQEINEWHLEQALQEHKSRLPAGESNTRCEDCNAEIPEPRRRAVPGCKRCIDCQTLLENWSAL